MKKIHLVFYWVTLLLLMFSYYVIIDALFVDIGSDISEKGLVTHLVAIINVPVSLVLVFFRLLLLKPVKQKNLYFEIAHFAIPVLISVACFAEQSWVGISLSALAGAMIVYEFITGIHPASPSHPRL